MPEENYIVDKNGIKRRIRRFYTPEFKQKVVDLYETGNYSRNDLCREYELSSSALNRWIKQSRNSGSFKAADNRTAEENELIHLRKENKQLLMENDILKQAALIFGRKENQR